MGFIDRKSLPVKKEKAQNKSGMKVLVFTHMYPMDQHPQYGVFIQQQVESLRREGIDVDVLFVNPKASKWNYPLSLLPFLKRVFSRKYDLVHAHYVFAGIVARIQLRYPLVVTHHGDEALWGWQKKLCWGISRLADKVIVVSEQMKEALALNKAEVIPCGVNFDLFRPMPQDRCREELDLPRDKRLVLFVGDYPKRLKRFDLIQESMALLKKDMKDVELVVAYNQPYTMIPVYMNACDVLVLASDREGSPQVVKEAMACNLPIVSVEVGDVPDVLAGIEGCHLCQREPADIGAKLAVVLNQRQRTNGRSHTERYEISNIAKGIIRVYEEVLSP